MGYYINPQDMSKEEFLARKGIPIFAAEVLSIFDYHKDHLPVCLIDNGAFTAAGIAYSKDEAATFCRNDGRYKRWYKVSKKDLEPYYKEKHT